MRPLRGCQNLVQETNQRVEAELPQSADRSAEYDKGKTEEFKEIMMIMARTTEAIGDRDQPYSKRFTNFTTRLHALASIEDLTKIRDSLVSSAPRTSGRREPMALDGEEASRGCAANCASIRPGSKRWSGWDRWNA